MLSKWFKTNACFGFNHQLQLSSFAAVKSQRKEKQKSMISGRFFSYIFVHLNLSSISVHTFAEVQLLLSCFNQCLTLKDNYFTICFYY